MRSTGNGTLADTHGAARAAMLERHIAARGIEDANVLRAIGTVPRERFVPEHLQRWAYDDAPLPIGEGQTISQPYVVAFMAAAAELAPDDRVLEVGTGSGYAAAVFSRASAHVYTVERHTSLAREARRRFDELGYANIDVAVRDGTLGWPEHAPYDAIIVAAAGPGRLPPALLEQLAPGGRLVIPRGETQDAQDLVRIRRSLDGESFSEDNLGPVRFVPLIGAAGWSAGGGPAAHAPPPRLSALIAEAAEPFDDVDSADLGPLLARIGEARLVLIGEATHGTSEFYSLRARITSELIERAGFDFVAVEADWPDAAEIDAYVRHSPGVRPHHKPFQRFPQWMWANEEVMRFVHWLRAHNDERGADPSRKAGFHGLDLYSLYTSIEAVLHYLDEVDPRAADVARERYACLTPWQNDPVLYGRAALSAAFDTCEADAVAMLNDLMRQRLDYVRRDGARFFDAAQNARLIVSAEKYYRVMYRGSVASWNLRDQHMFDTLSALLQAYGPGSRGVVWAHNSHLGNAAATEMGGRGEYNVGQLAREAYGADAYLVGFGTHDGTVAAASDWGARMQVMQVRPSHERSYERCSHDSGVANFMLPLRAATTVSERLMESRLERAIGVIYRPETELQSHYFDAVLPQQFDEWIWIDRSSAVTPIGEQHRAELDTMPDTFPFGL